MANSASRNTIERAGQVLEALPVASGEKLYVGALSAADANGKIVPAADAASLTVLGRCEGQPGPGLTGQDADNTDGGDGDLTVNIKRGTFKFDNSSGDAVTGAEIGKACYVEDDATVNKTGGTNHIKAGLVVGLDDDGDSVWVDTSLAPAL
jgi:hypothetical protein